MLSHEFVSLLEKVLFLLLGDRYPIAGVKMQLRMEYSHSQAWFNILMYNYNTALITVRVIPILQKSSFSYVVCMIRIKKHFGIVILLHRMKSNGIPFCVTSQSTESIFSDIHFFLDNCPSCS
jgi:hypothetical protein